VVVTHLAGVADWLAWFGIFITLASLAWSAKRYVDLRKVEDEHARYRRFFEIMDMLGSSGSIASKVAAAYQLRSYPEYADLLERFCRESQRYVRGDSAELLLDELRRTTEHFEARRRRQ
jgi:hypothetical protein